MSPEFAPDSEVTSSRRQGLSILPASFAEIEEHFPSTQDTQEFIDWGTRTKRIHWDSHQAAWAINPKGPKS